MNARTLIQSSLVAALFAAGAAAQAAPVGEGDTLNDHPVQVQSKRSFSEAQAASLASTSRDVLWATGEAYGYDFPSAAGNSDLSRESVRQAAIRAERSGQIQHGDAVTF